MTAGIEAMLLQVKEPQLIASSSDFSGGRIPQKKLKSTSIQGTYLISNDAIPVPIMHFNKRESITSRAIERNFDMGDFAKSLTTEEEAIELYQQLKQSLQNGGFNLTNWRSNSATLMEFFTEDDKAEKTVKSFEAEPSASPLLGLRWTMGDDSLELCRGATKAISGR